MCSNLINKSQNPTASLKKINLIKTINYHKYSDFPKDISEFMDGAEHGVILLTMGMTYFPSDIPPHLEAELIKAFSRVKQRVLIKLHK